MSRHLVDPLVIDYSYGSLRFVTSLRQLGSPKIKKETKQTDTQLACELWAMPLYRWKKAEETAAIVSLTALGRPVWPGARAVTLLPISSSYL